MVRRVQTICVFVLAATFPVLAVAVEVSRYVEPYPIAASKKGLQVEMVDDALALGVKHAALNVDLTRLVDPSSDPANPSWQRGGKTYYFRRDYLTQLDQQIRSLSSQGVLVSLILLTYQSADPAANRLMLHPQAVAEPPNRLCAFNTVTPEGREWLSAMLEFVAERWSRPAQEYGRVVGYIVGNEVNSHWWWSNRGLVGMQEFADDYLQAVRLAHKAIRSQSSWARIYVSLEHHWNIRYPAGNEQQAFPARQFLNYFAEQARATGDFDWHVAFHPYPENLFDPKFWEDETALHASDTPRVTFKNLEVLTEFLHREEILYRGQPRRVILSEQGFHTPDGEAGELVQAAAYCYAYKRVERLAGIDAFILHRHVDHRAEGSLLLGLRRWDQAKTKKKIYDCFRLADTPDWEQAFEFALPLVGLQSWD